MNQNLCFEYQQLMSRYNNIQLELKKNDSQHQRQQIKKEKLSKELKNNKNNNLKVKEMPTQQHHRLNFSKLFKNIKPAPVVVPAEEAVVVPAAMKNIILFKALQQIMFKRQ